MTLAYLPSPGSSYLSLGPLMIHWYAIMIILGVAAAIAIAQRRWTARGGSADAVLDVAFVALPFGILGGRLYHVITSWQLYFSAGKNPVEALYIWHGGLGVWGAVAGGAVGAWIAARRRGIDFAAFADAVAPAVAVGQAIVTNAGEWIQYSTPHPEGAEYIAVCLPAFSPHTVHRDE